METTDAYKKHARKWHALCLNVGIIKRQIVLNVYMFERYLNYLLFDNNCIILLQ